MKKLLLLSIPFLLVGCGGGGGSTDASITDQPSLPAYCIREVVELDNGKVLLDMPGYPHGSTDAMMEISRETLEWITSRPDSVVKDCSADDPRMELKPNRNPL